MVRDATFTRESPVWTCTLAQAAWLKNTAVQYGVTEDEVASALKATGVDVPADLDRLLRACDVRYRAANRTAGLEGETFECLAVAYMRDALMMW